MLTQTDFAERTLTDYLENNKDKIMEALNGDETLFDAKKQKALEELYNYDTLDHDEGDIDILLNEIFELGIPAGDIDNDYGPTGIANPAEYMNSKEKEEE